MSVSPVSPVPFSGVSGALIPVFTPSYWLLVAMMISLLYPTTWPICSSMSLGAIESNLKDKVHLGAGILQHILIVLDF